MSKQNYTVVNLEQDEEVKSFDTLEEAQAYADKVNKELWKS